MCDVSVPPIATKVRIHHGRFNQFRHCYSLIFASLTSGGGFLTVSFFCPPNLVSLSDGQDGAAFLPKEHFELYEKSEELIRLASLFGSLSCQIIRQNRSTSSRQKSRDILYRWPGCVRTRALSDQKKITRNPVHKAVNSQTYLPAIAMISLPLGFDDRMHHHRRRLSPSRTL